MKSIIQKASPIFPIITFTVCCIVFYFLLKEIDKNQTVYQEKETQWQTEVDRRASIRLLNNSISKIQKEKDLLESHFAESTNAVPFLDTLESIGEKARVKAQVVSVDISKDGKSLTVELKAVGSFESIYKYILLLENSPYELDFVSTSIQKENSSDALSKKSSWSADIKVKLLSFVP